MEKLSMQESLPDHTRLTDVYEMPQTHSVILGSLHHSTHTHMHTCHSTLLPAGEPDPPTQLVYTSVEFPVGEDCRGDLPDHRRLCRDWSGTSRSSFISPQGTNTNLSNK